MSNSTYIIAEIGINHEGNFERCCEMIHAARKSNVNAIKLQTIDADKNYAKDTESYELFKKSSLSRKQTKQAFDLARSLNLDCFTTVGDIETAKWIKKLRPQAWKISSSLITHVPLIDFLSKEKEHLYLSTGLSNNSETDKIIKNLKRIKKNNFTVLHCISKYPLKTTESSLKKILVLKDKYKVKVGYSDHTKGTYSSCIAVALGARVIEKHFTLDKKMMGFDHKISLDFSGMEELVKKIRMTEEMLSLKKIDMETNRRNFLRVLVANKNIKNGETFNESNIAVKRVKNNFKGLSPLDYKKVLGRKSKKKYGKDEKILYSEIN